VVALVNECGVDVTLGRSPFIEAAVKGHTHVLRALVSGCGMDVNTANNEGWTPLMTALQFGRDDSILCLFTELNADVGSCNSLGVTCLHVAAVMSASTATADHESLSPDHLAAALEKVFFVFSTVSFPVNPLNGLMMVLSLENFILHIAYCMLHIHFESHITCTFHVTYYMYISYYI
jgi:hypothetical protein